MKTGNRRWVNEKEKGRTGKDKGENSRHKGK
jgi:hypothetical protein